MLVELRERALVIRTGVRWRGRWRRLPEAARRDARWQRVPRQVALSMAFEKEPVDESWLKGTTPPGHATRTIETASGVLTYAHLAPLLAVGRGRSCRMAAFRSAAPVLP